MAQSNDKSPGSNGESKTTTRAAQPKGVWSWLLVKILWSGPCYYSLKLIGFLFEWTINFFVLNPRPFKLLFNLSLPLRWDKIATPDPKADNYLSCIGHLDPRVDLYVDTSKAGKADSTRADTVVFPAEHVGARSTADVCVMAAKLAYENRNVVKRVVEENWRMHFVKFYNCWNDYQQMANTQAFIFTDKPTEPNAVVVAFRGTEPFNSYDWSTDFDFAATKLEGLGGVHIGFLEALGLVNRKKSDSLEKLLEAHRSHAQEKQEKGTGADQKSLDEKKLPETCSGLNPEIIANPKQKLAYDEITLKLALLLQDNPKAKLFITGHSLGGALSALYATMLHYTDRKEVYDNIAAVYTFGQPRVGDRAFANYATDKLKDKYFRVVYCNDVVPRVPFDNRVFKYKHIGDCSYFNSVYNGLSLRKEPNRNFLGMGRMITMHLNAVWEFFQGLFVITEHGHEYSESFMCLLFRAMGLLLPGISSHSPCNYVNSVRLGPLPLGARLKDDINEIAEEFHLMHDNVKDILWAIITAIGRLLGFE